ncbi:DUF3631 domain-containing protein [Paraburkholderia sp. Cpub6]|uniref:DUF3631 domain-containing protein n=1 Tax=Paraburkholderia sp. Cpub6 TaxID=2723094 RepID=UPI0016178599|nr:DUF3631 domain-containing protein [Paraburkholderia sp. Cpub6]MBB5458689.1 hypothetical protein [Paraburkholderia sp. Cpub6]
MNAVIDNHDPFGLEAWKDAARRLFAFKTAEGFQPAALHLYRAADGAICYARVRLHKPLDGGGHEKFIRPFWHDGKRWTHGEPKQEGGKLLYGLCEAQAAPDALLVVAEGEQKADALTRIGAGRLVGITSGSATSAGGADWSPLAGRTALLWPDHDDSGTRYADEVTAKLGSVGCAVGRLDVAAMGLPPKGDVVDWLDQFKVAHGRAPDADDVLALPRVGAPPAVLATAGETVPGDASAADTEGDAAPPETDDEVIARLAALRPMEYDRARKTEAARLKVRPTTLDLMVREARGETGNGEPSPFEDVEPWHEPVDGTELLAGIARTIRRFIVCDPETVTAAALWCVAAWLVDHIGTCPILLVNAPEKACGKTQLLTVVGRMVPRPAQAAGISPSVLFRMIEKYQPTLLVDEIETVLTKEAEDLRGLLNAGHTRDSAFVWRSVAVGDDFEPKRFNVFGFKALAGINADRLAETITSRSVVAALRRKLPHESVERLRHAEPGLFDRLRAKIARWAEDHADAIRAARPELPAELGDRDQDNWEPLLAVADLVGGTWPAWTRTAAIKLCGNGDQAQSRGAELLADIQDVFDTHKAQRIFSADLLERLCEDEEKPWATWNRGKPMALKQLATRLGEYSIRSAQIRIGYESKKGYLRSQFDDAFSRYLPSSLAAPLSSETTKQPRTGAASSVSPVFRVSDGCETGNRPETLEPLSDKGCFVVSGERGKAGENGNSVTCDEPEEDI